METVCPWRIAELSNPSSSPFSYSTFHPSQYPMMRWQSKVPILSVDLDSFSLNALSYLSKYNGIDPKERKKERKKEREKERKRQRETTWAGLQMIFPSCIAQPRPLHPPFEEILYVRQTFSHLPWFTSAHITWVPPFNPSFCSHHFVFRSRFAPMIATTPMNPARPTKTKSPWVLHSSQAWKLQNETHVFGRFLSWTPKIDDPIHDDLYDHLTPKHT